MKTKEPPCTEPYARWCERSANQLMVSLLLDSYFAPLRCFSALHIIEAGKDGADYERKLLIHSLVKLKNQLIFIPKALDRLQLTKPFA